MKNIDELKRIKEELSKVESEISVLRSEIFDDIREQVYGIFDLCKQSVEKGMWVKITTKKNNGNTYSIEYVKIESVKEDTFKRNNMGYSFDLDLKIHYSHNLNRLCKNDMMSVIAWFDDSDTYDYELVSDETVNNIILNNINAYLL